MKQEGAPQYEQGTHAYTAEVYDPTRKPWEQIGPMIMDIATQGFPPLQGYERYLRAHFTDTRNTAILLRHTPKQLYVGFAYAEPVENVYHTFSEYQDRRKYPHTAYISATVIRPEYQGKRLIQPLMEMMEDCLRQRQYAHMEIDSLDTHGFSEAIKRWYGQRIDPNTSYTHVSSFGKQTYFRIAL